MFGFALWLVLVALAPILLGQNGVGGGICAPMSTKQKLEATFVHAVFLGTVAEIVKADRKPYSAYGVTNGRKQMVQRLVVTFQVNKFWKGDMSTTVRIYESLGLSYGMPLGTYKAGQEFLIYAGNIKVSDWANKEGSRPALVGKGLPAPGNNVLTTVGCWWGTIPADKAGAEIQELEKLTPAKAPR